MNQITNKRDVDAHLHCVFCKDLTGDSVNLLRLEHGNIEYLEHLDVNAFDPDAGKEYHICEVCTLDAYSHLIDEWEEAEELSIAMDINVDEVDMDDPSWVTEYFFSSEDVPRTWFRESEPDQCPRCLESHDTGDAVVQVSVVQREGRRFSDPIPQQRAPDVKNRHTWVCENCVSEFYRHVRRG